VTPTSPNVSDAFRSHLSSLSSLLRECDSVLACALIRYFDNCHSTCQEDDVTTKLKISSFSKLIVSLHGDPLGLFLAFLAIEIEEEHNLSLVMRERSRCVSILQSIWSFFGISDVTHHLDLFILNLSLTKIKFLSEDSSSSHSSKRCQYFKVFFFSHLSFPQRFSERKSHECRHQDTVCIFDPKSDMCPLPSMC